MRKLFLGFVMVVALAAVSSVAPPDAQGQVTKKGAKAGVIEIGEGKDGKFRFFVRDDEGKLLAMSSPGGFASEKDARAAIETLKEVIGRAKVTMAKKVTKDKKGTKDKKKDAKDKK